ncbi:unnamed protein product [Thlaspi arvense]|uniref:DC1 domain-containing protein n=1 Tax=Thlaspi arvense TaxID=13288 RepID=A0AAU9S0L5_THLAR|nr:unnamed protein product [Thlaspi arvense]
MEHLFHRHPLTLEVNTKEGFFSCSKCERESCGFMYQCDQKECEFKMDAKCASLADPLHHGAHQHPLALYHTGASCDECRFYLGIKTLILPILVNSKHDTHPLTICFSRTIERYNTPWCEICEAKINQEYPGYQNLYGCAECNTTLHVECAMGKYPFLKPGRTIKVNGFEIEIASNGLSRQVCHACHCLCQDKLVFKDTRDAVSFCSINCIKRIA